MAIAKKNTLKHIGIIMDGNGRWAKSKSKPRIFGHRSSISSVDASIEYCAENNVSILTLFAFSRDNWLRPNQEVCDLMDLLYKTLKDRTPKLHQNNIFLKVFGDRSRLSSKLIEVIKQSENLTRKNTGLELRLAVDYSGRWDLIETTKAIARDITANKICVDSISEQYFNKYLIGGNVPIDLLIRTSGEVRLSDFMLWHLAYAEMYFTDVMWPDFSKSELNKAVEYFYSRQRRFGKSSC